MKGVHAEWMRAVTNGNIRHANRVYKHREKAIKAELIRRQSDIMDLYSMIDGFRAILKTFKLVG